MKKLFLIPVVLYLFVIQSYSQWTPDWDTTYTKTTTSADLSSSIKVKGGNVYITGSNYDSATIYTLTTIKYNTSGVQQWKAVYSPSNPIGGGIGINGPQKELIDVDGSGNVYVLATISNGTNDDFVTIKYNSSGTQQWVVTYDGSRNDEAGAIAVDYSGNVYITGGSVSKHGSNWWSDITTICYNTSGAQQWLKRFTNSTSGKNGNDAAWSIILDTNSSHVGAGVYVAGWYDRGNNLPTL